MECGIEVGDALDTGELFAACADDLQSREVVSACVSQEDPAPSSESDTYNGAKSSIPFRWW